MQENIFVSRISKEEVGRPEDPICTKMARNVNARTRNAVLLGVKMRGKETTIKYQINVRPESGQNPSDVDTKDVFCYKLLEVMEIGPRCNLCTQHNPSSTRRQGMQQYEFLFARDLKWV